MENARWVPYLDWSVVTLRRSGMIVPHFEGQIERSNSMATRFWRLTKGFRLWENLGIGESPLVRRSSDHLVSTVYALNHTADMPSRRSVEISGSVIWI